jgi:hypothetical protein
LISWELLAELKSLVSQGLIKYRNSVDAQLRAIGQMAIDSCQQPEVRFLSKEHTPLKKSLPVFPGYCCKND